MPDRATKLLLGVIAAGLIGLNVQLLLTPRAAQAGFLLGPTFGEWKAAPLLQKNQIKDQALIVVDLR